MICPYCSQQLIPGTRRCGECSSLLPEPARSSEESSRPAPCSGALTWSAEKPAAGGWWWSEAAAQDGFDPRVAVRLVRELRPYGNRLCIFINRVGWYPIEDLVGWRFAGPLPEPVEASSVEPLPNDES